MYSFSETQCPQLTPPINGAIIQLTVNERNEWWMQCNNKYDIPAGIDGFYGFLTCYDSGNWGPLPEFPSCCGK